MIDDRRMFLRLNAKIAVTYHEVQSPQDKPTVTKNIGGGGICILASDLVPMGTVLKLEIRLPDEERLISFTGEVVWSSEATIQDVADSPIIQLGVRFLNIDPKDHQAIIRHCITHI